MVLDQSMEVFNSSGSIALKITIIICALLFIVLFLAMTFIPILKQRAYSSTKIHSDILPLQNLQVQPITNVIIALDFSKNDEKLIAHALSQGGKNAAYLLVHIVESASAKYLGADADDDETRIDKERLHTYAKQLNHLGYNTTVEIGYRNRVKEIVRIVKDSNANMLVMGAHRHSGIKDYFFGETIEAVRHQITIPVLVVNV
jgi:manganese transport protein